MIDWMAECGDVGRRLSSDSESGNHQRPPVGGQTTATTSLVPSRSIKIAGCEVEPAISRDLIFRRGVGLRRARTLRRGS